MQTERQTLCDDAEGQHSPEHQNSVRHSGRSYKMQMLNYFLISSIALIPPYILGFSLITNAVFLGLGLILSGIISERYDAAIDGQLAKIKTSDRAADETEAYTENLEQSLR